MSSLAKGEQALNTVNRRKSPPAPPKYRSSRALHTVSPLSGKDVGSKEKGFFNRPWRGGKTPWDWMNFLATLLIPLVVLAGTIWFGFQQAHLAALQNEQGQRNTQDQQRADILQKY